MGHGPTSALFQGKTRLGAVEGLNLTFLVDTQDQGLIRWIDSTLVPEMNCAVRLLRARSRASGMAVALERKATTEKKARLDSAIAAGLFYRNHNSRSFGLIRSSGTPTYQTRGVGDSLGVRHVTRL